jgi:hypothetical protein
MSSADLPVVGSHNDCAESATNTGSDNSEAKIQQGFQRND